jgi:hypothetical protein
MEIYNYLFISSQNRQLIGARAYQTPTIDQADHLALQSGSKYADANHCQVMVWRVCGFIDQVDNSSSKQVRAVAPTI